MAPTAKDISIGRITGTIYDYAQAGDTLPVHTHDEAHNHITIIARGSFRCLGDPAIAGRILQTGAVVIWPAGQEHGFEALEDGARMVQIRR